MPGALRLQRLTATQSVEEQRQGALILDIRAAERFAALHIRGAIQISLEGSFGGWAAILIKPTQRLVLVGESLQRVTEADTRLGRVGLGQGIGYSLAHEIEWRSEGVGLARISIERCANVRRILRSNPGVQLVDVRSRAEWLKGRLPSAISVPLLDLESGARFIDPSRPSLVYCREGYRATTAASILSRKSSADLGILIDGIQGWLALGLPLEIPAR